MKFFLCSKVIQCHADLNSCENPSHHLNNVREQEPLSTAHFIWLSAASFDSHMNSNQGAVSLTSYLLGCILLQYSAANPNIFHLFFMEF